MPVQVLGADDNHDISLDSTLPRERALYQQFVFICYYVNHKNVHTLCGVVGITPDCNICCHPLVTGSTPVGGTFFLPISGAISSARDRGSA
jgi:hypothetical protein